MSLLIEFTVIDQLLFADQRAQFAVLYNRSGIEDLFGIAERQAQQHDTALSLARLANAQQSHLHRLMQARLRKQVGAAVRAKAKLRQCQHGGPRQQGAFVQLNDALRIIMRISHLQDRRANSDAIGF